MADMEAPGSDKFGEFIVDTGHCGVCGQASIRIKYQAFSAMGHDDLGSIDSKHLIIGAELKYVGVTCGCYGRLHRQVAHIRTEQKYARR